MGGGTQTIKTADQKFENLRINTSSYGQPIPLAWGKPRLSAQLIDYTDFTAVPHVTETESSGGKGGGGVKQENTSYTYTVAVDMLLCEGAITGVPKVWVGKNPPTSLGHYDLGLFTGTRPQTTWSYMDSNHPERALHYPGMAHIVGVYDLGSDSSIPNFSFEVDTGKRVTGHDDASPKVVLMDFLSNPMYGVGFPSQYVDAWQKFDDFCYAYGIFLSPALVEQKEAYEFIKEIAEATNSQPLWSEGLLKMIPYCDEPATGNGRAFIPDNSPLYDLTDDDFLDDGDDPVKLKRSSAADAFNSVQIEYYNRHNSYNAEIIEARDQADVEDKGLRQCDPITMHSICEPEVAQVVAQAILQRMLYIRNQFEFRLPWRFCLLEPMDLVRITDEKLGLDKAVVRIIEKEEDEYGTLTFTVEECPVGIYGLTKYPTAQADRAYIDYNASPGDVIPPVIFEPPAELVANGLELWVALSGVSPMWGGAVVYVSYDDETYQQIGTIKNRARYGKLTSKLLAGTRLDTMDVLSVDLSACKGQLEGCSQGEFESNYSLCYVDGEYISYRDAELTGENRYNVTYMNRGLYNTPVKEHGMGSDFVRVDSTIFKYPYKKEDIGKTIYLKFASFNVFNGTMQSLADVRPYLYTIQGTRGIGASVPFTVTQSGTSLICEITKNVTDPNGQSFYTYELRMGSTWDSSVLMGSFSGNKYTFDAHDEGTMTFWLKTIDSFGNYSNTATQCVMNVVGLPKRNVIYEQTSDPATWTGDGVYLADDGWHLKSARAIGDYVRFADMFGKTLVRRSNASILLPTIDLGQNILDSEAFYFDKYGNAKLRTVEVLGDFVTFGEIFTIPVHYVVPEYAVETIMGIEVVYNAIDGARVECEYRTSLDGTQWSGWVSSSVKQFYGRFIQIRLTPISMDGTTPVIIDGVKIKIDVPDVEDTIVNVNLPAAKTTVKFNKMFTNVPNVGVFTQDLTGQAATWRITNITTKSFDIELLDKNGNLIPGKLIQAIIRGY
jgi:hypothetical protein